ncbi:MAG: hypothetical protein HN348_02380 [Proteobacteria bacterium]|jgi:hypothetical protein|nr:hypothetical protein [Pseudomonadota bacterium]
MVRRPAIEKEYSDTEIPWFFWDRTITAGELRSTLADTTHPHRLRLLAVLLREERPDRVWHWTTPQAIADVLPLLLPLLGRQSDFWKWIFTRWRSHGFVT